MAPQVDRHGALLSRPFVCIRCGEPAELLLGGCPVHLARRDRPYDHGALPGPDELALLRAQGAAHLLADV